MWAVPARGGPKKRTWKIGNFGFLLAYPHLNSFHFICFFVLLSESEFDYVKHVDLYLSEIELPMACKCLS